MVILLNLFQKQEVGIQKRIIELKNIYTKNSAKQMLGAFYIHITNSSEG